MKCEICGKEYNFLYFIGKSNVCHKCVAKHTVFTEVKESDDVLLRKAMRAFDIKSFGELLRITPEQKIALEEGRIRKMRNKTFKYKSNKGSSVRVGKGDSLDYQEEYDIE